MSTSRPAAHAAAGAGVDGSASAHPAPGRAAPAGPPPALPSRPLELQRLLDQLPGLPAAVWSAQAQAPLPGEALVSWPVPRASAAQVAAAHAELTAMPPGRVGVVHRRAKREHFRLLRVMVGKTRAAPARLRAADHARAAEWAQDGSLAAAGALAQLRLARAAMPAYLALDGRGSLGPPLPTAAGVLLGTSVGMQRGSHALVTDLLENSYAALSPQRPVYLPWTHWVGAYGRPVSSEALAYDALAVMAGMGLDPDHHPWALFGHGTHWHLVASRVRDDGRTLRIDEPGIALRLTVDALDAESGFRSAYDMVGTARTQAAPRLRSGTMAAQLRGRDAAGRLTIEEIPVQGPQWALRLAQLGAPPPRVEGLLVLVKPSYRHLAGIIRHCMDGED